MSPCITSANLSIISRIERTPSFTNKLSFPITAWWILWACAMTLIVGLNPTINVFFLFLGDSFTEGVGGYCGKDMPSQFEDLTSKDTIAINAGIVGSDPFFQTRWYRDTFKSFPHHEVVFVLNDSDLVEFVTRGGNERFRGESVQYKKGPWFEVVYQYSHTVRAIVHGLLGQNHIF